MVYATHQNVGDTSTALMRCAGIAIQRRVFNAIVGQPDSSLFLAIWPATTLIAQAISRDTITALANRYVLVRRA